MSPFGNVLDGRSALAVAARGVLALLAGALLAGCDRPVQPFEENHNGPYSLVGYLDARADTQWVRVMPVRQSLLTAPEPIDAVVTLQHLGSGRSVTLRDSLFAFTDPRLGGAAYAHVFWTTEPLQGRARYRLRAVRSDGDSSTAVVEMPPDLEFTFQNFQRDTAWVEVQAERVLLVETLHAMRSPVGDPGGSAARRQRPASPSGRPGLHTVAADGTPLAQDGLVDVGRTELRIVAARSDWPYHDRLSDLTVTLPSTMPSNVENGLGFVGGVVSWTIPFHRCAVLALPPDGGQPCTVTYNRQSASIAGRVVRQPCGRPHTVAEIRLTERLVGGGAIVLRWKTGWDGAYRFEGLEPGAELSLQLTPTSAPVRLPRLAPGQRYVVPDISVAEGC